MHKSVHTNGAIFCYKALSKLPILTQRMIAMVFTRLQEAEPETVGTKQLVEKEYILTWGWTPLLAVVNACGVYLVAYAYTSARNGAVGVEIFYWLGLLLIFVPSVARLLSPVPTRFERIALICIVGVSFYIVALMFSPLYVSSYDEFLHWRTVNDITRSGHLFTPNAMLPVSPFYPGLEIVTNAFSVMSGLSIFQAGIVVIGVARLIMVLSLFLFYERVMTSARMAGIATTLYMTNPHFLFFDVQFAYESMALPLAMFALFAIAQHQVRTRENRWMMLAAWIALIAVILTHHVTDFVFNGILILWTMIYSLQRPMAVFLKSKLVKTTLFMTSATVMSIIIIGNTVTQYLSSYFLVALQELKQILAGTSNARPLFAVYGSQAPPLWERLVSLSSVALIGCCLPFGLFCLWRHSRSNALLLTLGIISLAYPVSQIFRFTDFGSEITDRSAAFIFIGITCVLTIFIVQLWPTRYLGWKQTSLITCAISILFLGGVIIAASAPWQTLPGPYLVGADERSIEPEGIQTALWTYSHLGLDKRMATDRTNRLLMSTYGDQHIVTNLDGGTDETPIFLSKNFGADEVSLLEKGQVRYLVVDLRLSMALPRLGFYFDVGEQGTFQHTVPIDRAALTKFSTVPQLNRVYDSGNIVIYDTGELINVQKKP